MLLHSLAKWLFTGPGASFPRWMPIRFSLKTRFTLSTLAGAAAAQLHFSFTPIFPTAVFPLRLGGFFFLAKDLWCHYLDIGQ
jgi:hypothetical protein